MEQTDIITALSALAQPTRLEVFRLLVRHEPEGLPAGEIARRLAAPHNTMSSHLTILARAGLVSSERRSRSIIYRASLDQIRNVLGHLLADCCGGHPDVCTPLLAVLAPCCAPKDQGNV